MLDNRKEIVMNDTFNMLNVEQIEHFRGAVAGKSELMNILCDMALRSLTVREEAVEMARESRTDRQENYKVTDEGQVIANVDSLLQSDEAQRQIDEVRKLREKAAEPGLSAEQIEDCRAKLHYPMSLDHVTATKLCNMALASLTLRDDGIGELAKAKLPGKNARAILPLLEELEEANAEIMEQCRLNAMGSEREAKLMAEIDMERKRRWEGNEISSNEHIAEVVQLKEEIRRARDEGIEAAAKEIDKLFNDKTLSDHIRALKGATDDLKIKLDRVSHAVESMMKNKGELN